MKNSLEYRDLYVHDPSDPSGVLLKAAPFIWNEEIISQIKGREFEMKNPILKMKWLASYLDLDWKKFDGKNLKPIISYLHRCIQWSQVNNLSLSERKNLLKREFESFHIMPRFPFESLSKYFIAKMESDE